MSRTSTAEEAATPQVAREQAARQAGFTLIETMAVMLIVAILASLAIPWTRGTGRGQLKALALETADLARAERLGAILTRRLRHVAIDGERRILVGDGGRTVRIPDDVVLDVAGSRESFAGRRSLVRFEPDGSSSGAALRVARGGFGYEVRVNWYTGGVTVVEP
jgi:general secretion pathway protein H